LLRSGQALYMARVERAGILAGHGMRDGAWVRWRMPGEPQREPTPAFFPGTEKILPVLRAGSPFRSRGEAFPRNLGVSGSALADRDSRIGNVIVAAAGEPADRERQAPPGSLMRCSLSSSLKAERRCRLCA
jgi:hypothetical protein